MLGQPHFAPKAKRIIYLFMSGGPSQLDLFDYKPLLNQRHGEQLPDSVRGGQRLTGMSGNQSSIPLVGSPFKFAQHGKSGAWVSELLPHTAKIADDICVVRSMFTEAINHGPGVTFFQTGSQIAGRPSMGAWLSYGLGQENANLPAFVVLITKGKGGQPLGSHLWGSGFLPTQHQGVQFRAAKDPVLYLGNPDGISADSRRMMLDRLRELHEHQFAGTPDAEIQSRIDQYEMAFRMQTSVPEVTDLSNESPRHARLLRPRREDARHLRRELPAGAPARGDAACASSSSIIRTGIITAACPAHLPKLCKETDQPAAALDHGSESSAACSTTRSSCGAASSAARITARARSRRTSAAIIIRAASPSGWPAAASSRARSTARPTSSATTSSSDRVHVHDFHATMLHLLGIDHERLTYKFQGRRYRLTDVHGKVVKGILA